MIKEPLSPLLIFAMCKYCKHNVWRKTLFVLANRMTASQPHATAPSWTRTTPASWCQPRKSPCCRKILSAVSCQPVIRPVLKEIYPWSISCCAHCQRVRHWSAISCIRTSVRRRGGSKDLSLALHDKEESFFINSGTCAFQISAALWGFYLKCNKNKNMRLH